MSNYRRRGCRRALLELLSHYECITSCCAITTSMARRISHHRRFEAPRVFIAGADLARHHSSVEEGRLLISGLIYIARQFGGRFAGG